MRQQSWRFTETVQSVVQSQNNGPLIAAAAALWIHDGDTVLDATYGKGLFWTSYRPANLVTNDLYRGDTDHSVDFRATGFDSESFDVVVFDPPYIIRGGTKTSTLPDFLDRYGLDGQHNATAGDLYALIFDGMAELSRLLKPGGRLMVKCTDQISSGKYLQLHYHVVSTAVELGLTQVDEFIHYSGTGPGAWDRQLHSRRAHSFLCIFRKQ